MDGLFVSKMNSLISDLKETDTISYLDIYLERKISYDF